MLMGMIVTLSGGCLYWLLKPPMPKSNVALKEEIQYEKDSSFEGEVGGCLISK